MGNEVNAWRAVSDAGLIQRCAGALISPFRFLIAESVPLIKISWQEWGF